MILASKVLAWFCLTLSSILIYKIGCDSGFSSRTENLFIALITLTYPACQVQVELSMTPYYMCYLLFFVGVFLAFQAERTTAWRHCVLRTLSLLSFAACFSHNAFLVLYFGFLCLFFGCLLRRKEGKPRPGLLPILLRRSDYVLLPFAFWVLQTVFYPHHGVYTGIHGFELTPSAIGASVLRFLRNGVYGQFELAFESAVLLLVAALVFIWIAKAIKRGNNPCFMADANRFLLIAYGFLLLLLTVFPFVVTGRGPTLHGWDTRHALIMGLPIAVMAVGLLRATFHRAGPELCRAVRAVMFVLVLAFIVSGINNYLALQARWIKDTSIMANLSKMDEFKPYSIFVVKDRFLLPRVENRYRIYEWSSFFEKVWGGESRIGVEPHMSGDWLIENAEQFSVSRLKLSELDVSKGRRASLIIERGSQANSNAIMSARYFLKRFVRKSTLADFVEGVVKIDLAPIEL